MFYYIPIILVNILTFIYYHFIIKLENVDMNLVSININSLDNLSSFLISGFSHASLMHLTMNMLMLTFLSHLIYKMFSGKVLLLVYFSSLLFSSLISYAYIYMFNQNIIVVGASGAIFGLFSFYSFKMKDFKSFYLNLIIFHVVIILLQLPIAWYAHFSGALMGIILSYLIKNDLNANFFIEITKNKRKNK